MNLPHLEPVIFAKEVIEIIDKNATVFCKFDTLPTLPMFIEAAAQGSSAFDIDSKKNKIGFITKVSEINLLNNIEGSDYLFKIKIEIEVANIKQFYFEAYDKVTNIKTVSGKITLLIQE